MSIASRIALLLVLAVALLGCGAQPTLVLKSWRLDTESARDVAITLPKHLDHELPARRSPFTLRASVTLPPEMRGAPLTLAIPLLYAPVVLKANGRAMPPLDVGTTDDYRGNGHPRWSIPADVSAAPALDLELDVVHTWTQSAWLDAPPRLSATPIGDATYLAIRRVSDGCAVTGLAALGVAVLIYLTMFLLDRSRVEYAWWALEAGMGVPYTAFILGVSPAVVGVYDAPIMSIGLCLSIYGGVHFTHLQFGLPPPHRAWALAPIAAIGASLLFGGPFWSTRIVTPLTIVAVLANISYQLVLTVRRWRGTERRMQALMLCLGWGAVGVIGIPDFVAWAGLGEVAGGARTACTGIALIAILQSIVLGSDFIASLRHADRLNVELASRVDALQAKNREVEILNTELRRQIAARSEHLADALSRLTSSEEGPARELTVGDVVDGRYRVIASTGRGGMGVVYQVARESDGRRLALKLLAHAAKTDMARFAREAQIVSRLDHPNIVSIVDVDVASSGFFYIVMEYVQGRSLEEHRSRFGDVRWGLRVLRQIADGLAAIHAHGIVHRDLKPANVLMAVEADGSTSRVKIADFGISRLAIAIEGRAHGSIRPEDVATMSEARVKSSRPPPPSVGPTLSSPVESGVELAKRYDLTPSNGGSNLTETGMLMGTPRYMAPELVGDSKLARPACDLFSFGVIAYEILSATLPFREPAAVLRMNNESLPRPAPLVLRSGAVDPELVRVIERCLAEDPGARPTAARMVDVLSRAAEMVA